MGKGEHYIYNTLKTDIHASFQQISFEYVHGACKIIYIASAKTEQIRTSVHLLQITSYFLLC